MKYWVCLFLLISSVGYADAQYVQDTTEIYTNLKITKDPIRAKWQPMLVHEGNLWKLNFYDKKGILQESISYENKVLTVREGLYLLLKNGRIIEKGNYEKGYKHGWWVSFDDDGRILKRQRYKYDKLVEEN